MYILTAIQNLDSLKLLGIKITLRCLSWKMESPKFWYAISGSSEYPRIFSGSTTPAPIPLS